MVNALLCPVGVPCTLSSPAVTVKLSNWTMKPSELGQSPMLPACQGWKWLAVPQRRYFIPCAKPCTPKERAANRLQLRPLWAVHPSCSCRKNRPLLVRPLISRWQQTQQ